MATLQILNERIDAEYNVVSSYIPNFIKVDEDIIVTINRNKYQVFSILTKGQLWIGSPNKFKIIKFNRLNLVEDKILILEYVKSYILNYLKTKDIK